MTGWKTGLPFSLCSNGEPEGVPYFRKGRPRAVARGSCFVFMFPLKQASCFTKNKTAHGLCHERLFLKWVEDRIRTGDLQIHNLAL